MCDMVLPRKILLHLDDTIAEEEEEYQNKQETERQWEQRKQQ